MKLYTLQYDMKLLYFIRAFGNDPFLPSDMLCCQASFVMPSDVDPHSVYVKPLISFCVPSLVLGLFLYTFSLQVPTEIGVTVTKMMGSMRPEPFANYSVLKNVTCSSHVVVSSMCFSLVLL